MERVGGGGGGGGGGEGCSESLIGAFAALKTRKNLVPKCAPELRSGIDNGDVPVSFLPFFLFPVTVPKTNVNTDAHVSTPRYGHCLSMAATTGVIWLCACVRYWPYRGVGCLNWYSPTILGNSLLGPIPKVANSALFDNHLVGCVKSLNLFKHS